jgi:hypothetical protein
VIWKAVLKAFHVIGDGLAWRIGNGTKVRIGACPWPGCGNNHLLPVEIIQSLHNQGFFSLHQIAEPKETTIWHQAWKSAEQVGLEEVQNVSWSNYIQALKSSHIKITKRDDELVWQSAPHGVYTLQLGYIQLNINQYNREPLWWWKGLWKIKCPQNVKIPSPIKHAYWGLSLTTVRL